MQGADEPPELHFNEGTMMSSSIAKSMQGFEDMLKHQENLAAAAHAQLHTLRECNDRLVTELKSMKKALIDNISDAAATHPSQHCPQPLGVQVVGPEGGAGKHGETTARKRSAPKERPSRANKEPEVSLPDETPQVETEGHCGRVVEIAKTLEKDFLPSAGPDGMEEAGAEEEPARLAMFVKSPKFDMIVGGVIVANTIVMSLQLEVEGWAIKPGKCDLEDCTNQLSKDAFVVCEHIFTAIFALELTLRLRCEGLHYLKSVANMGDFMIVLVSSVDSWVLTPIGSEALADVGVLKLLRLMRLGKVFRVVRVMNAFRSLRVMVSAVIASMGALAWSMTLLFLLILIFAILMAQLVRSSIEDESVIMETRMFLWDSFGTWYNAMLTVFEMTMAPGGFIKYRRLVDDVNPMMGVVLVFYVCSVTFAVIRVITAMFLKTTLSESDKDEATVITEKTAVLEQYFTALQSILESTREPGSDDEDGLISEADLKELLAGPGMIEWLGLVGLTTADACRLHRSMAKGSGVVQLRDFVALLLRMRGNARASELIVLLHETRAMSDRLFGVEHEVAAVKQEYHAMSSLYSNSAVPVSTCAS